VVHTGRTRPPTSGVSPMRMTRRAAKLRNGPIQRIASGQPVDHWGVATNFSQDRPPRVPRFRLRKRVASRSVSRVSPILGAPASEVDSGRSRRSVGDAPQASRTTSLACPNVRRGSPDPLRRAGLGATAGMLARQESEIRCSITNEVPAAGFSKVRARRTAISSLRKPQRTRVVRL
jgi:hypothetical protein